MAAAGLRRRASGGTVVVAAESLRARDVNAEDTNE